MLLMFFVLSFVGCDLFDKGGGGIDNSGEPADGNKPTVVDSIHPNVGGIATPILLYGENFGSDTTKLHVAFVNRKNRKDSICANIIGSNGDIIYFNTPKLTDIDSLDVMITTVDSKGKTRVINSGVFKYNTETTVTTVAGIPFVNQEAAYTQEGNLGSATFSNPMFICVDADQNVIVIERVFNKSKPEMDTGLQPRINKNGKKENKSGIISKLNEKDNEVIILKNDANAINAPAVSPNGKSIYVPDDGGFNYYKMLINDDYKVSQRGFKKPSGYNDKSNWKFCFVTDPQDLSKYASVYTLMYNKELIEIDPLTNESKLLTNDIGTPVGSDSYLAFNPKEDKVLYASITNTHSIWRIDLKKEPVKAEPYAGLALTKSKISTNKDGDYANGTLIQSRFNYPRQITFDNNGVMYIADCVNHCIRSINIGDGTKTPLVKNVVGTHGQPGFKNGGPKQAQLNYPMGIAKAFDGTIYIADTRNYAIRKLVIQ